MADQHGAAGGVWKPGARAAGAIGRALDLVFPPQALDGAGRPQSSGLSAEAWSRIRFIAEACARAPLGAGAAAVDLAVATRVRESPSASI